MTYQTPRLECIGSASHLILGANNILAAFGDHDNLPVPPRVKGYSRVTPEV